RGGVRTPSGLSSSRLDAGEAILRDVGDLDERCRAARQARLLDDEDAVGGLGVAAAGQAADDAAPHDDPSGHDADQRPIRTLAAADPFEARWTLIVGNRKTFRVTGFPWGGVAPWAPRRGLSKRGIRDSHPPPLPIEPAEARLIETVETSIFDGR